MYTLRQPPSFTLFPYTTLFRSPQIVQAAEQTADSAVTSIISEISGGEKKPYKGKYDGFMVSIGARYGVANVGPGIRLHGWFANFVKHLINLVYLFGLRSGYYMVGYVRSEERRVG